MGLTLLFTAPSDEKVEKACPEGWLGRGSPMWATAWGSKSKGIHSEVFQFDNSEEILVLLSTVCRPLSVSLSLIVI